MYASRARDDAGHNSPIPQINLCTCSDALDTRGAAPSAQASQELGQHVRQSKPLSKAVPVTELDSAARPLIQPALIQLALESSWASPSSSRRRVTTPRNLPSRPPPAPPPLAARGWKLSPLDIAYGLALRATTSAPFAARADDALPLEPSPPEPHTPRLNLAATGRLDERSGFDEQLQISLHIFESCQVCRCVVCARIWCIYGMCQRPVRSAPSSARSVLGAQT